MTSSLLSRRNFITGSASAVALISLPGLALGQTTTRIRLEWEQFKTTPQYGSFLNAVRTMRANTRSSSMSSWAFWTNTHVSYCPHEVAYFLAWHRGYLYYIEQQLRTVSGDNALTLPYWNYYEHPRIPAEFTDPATNNPLYVPRAGTNVYNALTLAPFASTVRNFQRGTSNAFETLIESAPHNPVHNLIGNAMATMQSPNDPIFYLHHANIDRLLHAWALPDGKNIPYTSNPYNSATSSSYWAGSFRYSTSLTLPRYRAYIPGWLGYDNANNNKPTALPPTAQNDTPHVIRVQAQVGLLLRRPANGDFQPAPGRTISASRRSLGGVNSVTLTEASVSARLPLDAQNIQTLRNTVAAALDPALQLPGALQSVSVVLDNLRLLGIGANGGYFYNVYLNLPAAGDVTDLREKHFIGTLGAFEIAGAAHHGGSMITLPATEVLAKISPDDLQEVTVSFERVNGERPPRGQVLRIGEVRIEVSTDAAFDRSPQIAPPPGQCAYC
jgi:tyrosinase